MCDNIPQTTVSLPAGEAPREARRVVRAALCREHAERADAAVELIASELVTDSVKHGAPPIELTVECQVADVLVSVRDGGSWLPSPGLTSQDLSWMLIDKVARSWGVEPVPDGRLLWCRVPSGELPSADDPDRRGRTVVRVAFT